jgi:hypothetical protein
MMPKILMMTTDQMIDRRILLESDALAEDGWEVMILATAGARPDHSRVVRTAANRERVLPRICQRRVLWDLLRWIRSASARAGPTMSSESVSTTSSTRRKRFGWKAAAQSRQRSIPSGLVVRSSLALTSITSPRPFLSRRDIIGHPPSR